MASIVIHKEELNPVLRVNEQNKLDLVTSDEGNVKFSRTDVGALKADVEIPQTELPTIEGAQEGVRIPLVEAVEAAYSKSQAIDTIEPQVTSNTDRIEALEGKTAPTALTGASREGNTITFTRSNSESDITVDLPAVPVDVKLQSLEFTDQGKLKATLSDDSTAEVDFTAEVVVKALEAADSGQKARIKTLLLDILKGEEVQNLAGETKGFLLPAA